MSEWKEYKLGEVASFVKEKVAVQSIATDDYISTENMLPNKGGITLASGKPEEGTITKYYPNTILVSNIRPYFKKIWYADKAGGCSNDVLCFEAKESIVDSKYLFFLLSQDMFFDYVMLGSKGCKMPRGDKAHIMNWDISLPSLDEQRRIASILTSLDDKIDLLRRENATLEAMAETLFRQWFVVEAKEEWEEKPLSFFGRIVCGKTPPKKESKYFGGGIPFIKIPDMHKKTFVFDSADSLTEEGKLYQPDKTLPPFSIIVSCIATVGLVVLNAKEAQTNQQINSIIPYKDEYRCYLYLYLKNLYDELNAMASGGTATLNLNTGNFSKTPICYPGVDMLVAFHKQVKGVFEKIYYNQKQINTLIQTRDGLLPRLMSGEIKI